jgi:hypothetical protein
MNSTAGCGYIRFAVSGVGNLYNLRWMNKPVCMGSDHGKTGFNAQAIAHTTRKECELFGCAPGSTLSVEGDVGKAHHPPGVKELVQEGLGGSVALQFKLDFAVPACMPAIANQTAKG